MVNFRLCVRKAIKPDWLNTQYHPNHFKQDWALELEYHSNQECFAESDLNTEWHISR